VLCDVAREAANDVVERLQDHGLHREGAIVIEGLEVVVSDAAAAAEAASPGESGDALVWEQLEGRMRAEAALTISFVVFMSVAAIIAAIGILLDSPILVIGAMVVGPDYGPLAALCVAAVRRRPTSAAVAGRTIATGFVTAAAAALVATLLFRLTAIVGMLSLTEGRSGALVGVLVSVTTIPAIGNIGAAAAYGAWRDVGGAVAQLAINVTGLVIAGVLTLAVQAHGTRAHPDGFGRGIR